MARLLLIEDNEAQANESARFLESINHTVVCCHDGKTALKKATSEIFDLALLDLELPDMDGKLVCKWLKENPSTRRLPIIMLTAKGTELEKVEGLYSGANDFLSKPYGKLELEARIDTALRAKTLQDELEEKNTELQRLLKQVEKLSITDTMTGLFNRRHFNAVLEKEFNRHKRYKHPVSFLLIDIDHFKRINDTYGHSIGDMVIKRVASVLRSALRDADVVARWGGEEFIVFLPETTRQFATNVAEKLRSAVEEHVFDFPADLRVTVSVGVSCAPEIEIESANMFVDTADKALYLAKENGRNRVEVYCGS